MAAFTVLERRIAVNADNSRFRVQYLKDGKATAKVLKSLEEARIFRDRTDKQTVKKAKKTSTKAEKVERIKRAYKQRAKPVIQEIDLPGLSDVGSDKLKLVDRYLTIMEKMLGIN